MAADAVMRPDLGTAKAAKEALRLIGAGFAVRIAFLVVDALRQVALMKNVPAACFVGMNDCFGMNPSRDSLNALGFCLEHKGKCDPATFPHDDHDAALAGLVASQAAINAVFFPVGGFTWPPK